METINLDREEYKEIIKKATERDLIIQEMYDSIKKINTGDKEVELTFEDRLIQNVLEVFDKENFNQRIKEIVDITKKEIGE